LLYEYFAPLVLILIHPLSNKQVMIIFESKNVSRFGLYAATLVIYFIKLHQKCITAMSILLRQEGISTAYHVTISHSLAQQRRIRIITSQRSYLTTDQYLIGRSRKVITARAPTSNGHAGSPDNATPGIHFLAHPTLSTATCGGNCDPLHCSITGD
jgi:hypothetical protein